MTYTLRTTCRACGYNDLTEVLDLGSQPLANEFQRSDHATPNDRYPLTLVRCPACELVQLTVVVAPEIMYGPHYVYRSGFSDGWAAHCHALAKEIGSGKRVLEIGCLDGVMLRHCRDNGCSVQGIDPSSPVTDLPILREFFGTSTDMGGGGSRYDVIVAQNVFGHVDDPETFLRQAEDQLCLSGHLIIECPWIIDLVDGVRFDTIYHEHLSYWGLRPLQRLAMKVGLTVIKCQSFPEIHGGTMRYTLGRGQAFEPSVPAVWADEEMTGFDWRRFRARVSQQVDHWEKWFALADIDSVAMYGASAKANTFLNTLSAKPPIACILDDSPSKVGLVTPGWHIPVRAPSREAFEGIDTLLVGAPNWAKDLEAKARHLGFSGEVKSLWL